MGFARMDSNPARMGADVSLFFDAVFDMIYYVTLVFSSGRVDLYAEA